jgi:hypothetical protein
VKRALLLVVLAACGDDVHPTDPRLTGACIATFTGNFDESFADPANCPMITVTEDKRLSLGFSLEPAALGDTLGIGVDLGISPAPGRYNSTNAPPWSALGLRGGCVFIAGDTAVPPGSYTLDFDGRHGRLAILQHVLATQGSDCGAGDIEMIAIDF